MTVERGPDVGEPVAVPDGGRLQLRVELAGRLVEVGPVGGGEAGAGRGRRRS